MNDQNIYIGAKGAVVALDRRDGREIWRTELKGSGFVLVVLDADLVLAHSRGLLYALNSQSGEIVWQNGLEGLGYGHATITSENINAGSVMSVIQQMASEQAAAGAAGAGGAGGA